MNHIVAMQNIYEFGISKFKFIIYNTEGGRMEATRSKPRCQADCTEHVFQLINNNGNTKHNVTITFCPKFRRDPHPPQKTIPEFNFDKKYYTHAFVIGTEIKTIAKNSQHEYMSFQSQIKDACEKNNQIFFPRPNQKNSYCSVCKEHFKNYYEHIREEQHKIKIDAAIYNTEIKKLCDCYKQLWKDAPAKADEILQEIYRQKQKMQQENYDSNQNGDQDNANEQSEQDNEQHEMEQEVGQEQQKQVKNKNREQQSGLGNMINEEIQKKEGSQSFINDIRNEKQYQQKMNSQFGQSQNISRQKTGNPFFDKKQQLVVFLKRNKNGKYQIVKDINKALKQPVTATDSREQKQQKQSMSKQIISKEIDKKLTIKQNSTRIAKQNPRQVYKIKHPNRQRQQSSEYKANSSDQYNAQNGLCQTLKDKVMSNRIRTRNQIRHEDKHKDTDEVKEKYQPPYRHQKQRKQHPSKQKNARGNSIQEQMVQKQPPMPNYMNHPQMVPNRGGYPMYHPNPNQPMPQQGNRMPYMPPQMMNSYYNQAMMNYNMQMRNNADPNQKNDDKNKKPYPMYYHNPWGSNSYMMPPPSAMVGPPSDIGSDQPRQMPPGNPNSYPMMQNPRQQQAGNPNMPPPRMYMPYQMDHRYYMAYPPQYIPKKGEQPREQK